VNSIVAASSEAIVSTAVGEILRYDVSIPQQVGSTGFFAGKLALSSDGSVLAAAAANSDDQFVTDRSLNIYSLPSMNTMSSFPYAFNTSGTPFLDDFSLSGSGGILGRVLVSLPASGDSYTREVTGISGSPTVWTNSGNSTPIELSPRWNADCRRESTTAERRFQSRYEHLQKWLPGRGRIWLRRRLDR
jgi:hypothetical protein